MPIICQGRFAKDNFIIHYKHKRILQSNEAQILIESKRSNFLASNPQSFDGPLFRVDKYNILKCENEINQIELYLSDTDCKEFVGTRDSDFHASFGQDSLSIISVVTLAQAAAGGAGRIGCVATATDALCDGGTGAAGAAGGNNLGLRGSVDGGNSCEQASPFAPACATSNTGNGNGGAGSPGAAGGDSIGGNGGTSNDVSGGTRADGASACETSGSCVNDNSGSQNSNESAIQITKRKETKSPISFF